MGMLDLKKAGYESPSTYDSQTPTYNDSAVDTDRWGKLLSTFGEGFSKPQGSGVKFNIDPNASESAMQQFGQPADNRQRLLDILGRMV